MENELQLMSVLFVPLSKSHSWRSLSSPALLSLATKDSIARFTNGLLIVADDTRVSDATQTLFCQISIDK
jgi:hypothetical protein